MKRVTASGGRARTAAAVLALFAGLFVAEAADAQVYVYPRRPNKSQVRYYDFDWEHVDILVGPDADTSKADDMKRRIDHGGPVSPPDKPGPSDAPHVPPSGESPPSGAAQGKAGDVGKGSKQGEKLDGKPKTGRIGQPGAGVEATAPDGGFTEGADGGAPGASGGGASGAGPVAAGTGPAAEVAANDGGMNGASAVAGAADGGEGALASTEAPVEDYLRPSLIRPDVPFAPRELEAAADPTALLGSKTGGVRLYFYERERPIAERAAAIIVKSYAYLVGQFDYVPTQTFPYILYSSYQEFLQTNLFPLQEGVLGVTSPVDLKLTLPYFGDHELFEEVSAHEMSHQFTIQKVRTLTEKAQLWGDPLSAMPLWFVEGLAEYYAKRGIDDEAEMLVRDIVINPDFELGYTLLDFYEDRPFSVLWTYKMGQVRCAFLEETYGRGMIQRILEESPRLVGEYKGRPAINDFKELLAKLTGDEPKEVSAKFEAWLKRRAYRTYLSSQQGTQTVKPLEGFDEKFVDALQSSPSGNLMVVRSLDMDTGASRLTMFDPRAPTDDTFVAIDGVPGAESLHPVWGRNFDITDDQLAWVAESGGADVIYLQSVKHTANPLPTEEEKAQGGNGKKSEPPPSTIPPEPGPTGTMDPNASANPAVSNGDETRNHGAEWDVSIKLGARTEFDLERKGLIAAYSPTFSPDGKRLAFVGFTFGGNRDLYVLDPDPKADDGFRLTQVTADTYAERQVSWGPKGLVYNSDATSHGRYNLFRVDPDHPERVERLTTEARDHLDPVALADGRVLFTSYDRGRADIHEIRDGKIFRRTDITTGLFDLAPGPNGGLWALYHHAGRRQPVFVPSGMLETLETLPQPEAAPARVIPHRELPNAEPYSALRPRNWELGPPFGYIGGGTGGIYGQVVASASDKLNNHALLLNASILGSFELIDGYLVYLNQEKRLTWGGGIFSSLEFRLDQSLEDIAPNQRFVSTERFFGALGSVRYPLDQFVYLQGDLSVGGVNYFATSYDRSLMTTTAADGSTVDLFPIWAERNAGMRFQTEGTLRFGYDTIRYSAGGPIAGSSFMLETTGDWQPVQQQTFGTVRLDAERYFPIYGRTHFFLRTGMGTSFGGTLSRQFALSTFDTIRGIPYGAFNDFTIGKHFFFSTAEVQVPLNSVIRVLILTDIEAVAGVDFGGVGAKEIKDIWDHRVLSPVVGVNFGLGPLILRLHFAKPLDIGAPAGLPNGNGEWVTNFSIRIIGYEGLFDRSHASSERQGIHERPMTLMGERF